MILLSLDTSTRAHSVALASDGRLLAHREIDGAQRHSETMLPAVASLLSDAGITFGGLDAVAVTSGPGSFTGLRVGLSTAKGLALAGEIPAGGFSTLRILAEALAEVASREGRRMEPGTAVCAFMEAGRGQLYRGIYAASERALSPWLLDEGGVESIVQPGEALDGLPAGSIIGGEGLTRRLESMREAAPPGAFMVEEPPPLAPLLGRRASVLLDSGLFPEGAIEPNYIRAPDAVTNRSWVS